MPDNLIILGAGASFGSEGSVFGWEHDNYEKPPALGNNLFDDLKVFDPDGWGKLPDPLIIDFHNDFEQGMQKMGNNNPHWLPPLQRAMAAYFFNFRAKTNSLYVELASKIKARSWDGSIVTLNYERLLEQSLCHVGMRPICGSSPEKPEDIELCFPHGCCHIFNDNVRGDSSAISFAGPSVRTSVSKIATIVDPRQFFHRIQHDAFPPIMCYIDPTKTVTSGQNFIEDQKNRLNQLIIEAKNIAMVGVRVRPNDTHIWATLAKTNARVIYCAGETGASEFNSWKSEYRPRQDDIVMDVYFREGFNDLCKSIALF